MTVAVSPTRIIHDADGSVRVWAFPPCEILVDDHVKIRVSDADGVETEVTTNYSVNLVSRDVTYPVSGDPLPTGNKVVIFRLLPLEQNFAPGSAGWNGKMLETGIDDIAKQIQQIDEQVSRSFKTPISDPDIVDPDDFWHIAEEIKDARDESVAAKDESVSAKDESVSAKDDAIAAKDDAVTAKNDAVSARDSAIASASAASTSESNAAGSASAASSSESSASADAASALNSKDAAAESEIAADAAKVSAESARDLSEGYSNQLPAIADNLGVNLVTSEADLNTKLATIGSADATLVVAIPIPITADTTIPPNVGIAFHKPGKFVVPATKTLTINGPIAAGLWQIFDGDGSVAGSPKVEAVYPEWFGADGGDISHDDGAAITKALAFSLVVRFPVSESYYVASPIEMVEDMHLLGPAWCYKGEVGSRANIYAPNGFLANTTVGSRVHIDIRNLRIYGNSTAAVYALSGGFGGIIKGNTFSTFDEGINNPLSYITTISENVFEAMNKGLDLATANRVVVEGNLFNVDVVNAIDCQSLTGEGDGYSGGYPLIVRNNTFNAGSVTGSILKLGCGNAVISENYFEYFTAPTVAVPAIDVKAIRFSSAFLIIDGNHANGHSYIDRFIQIYSNNSLGTSMPGRITNNEILGFTDRPILIGSKVGGYDRVTELEIAGNNGPSQTDYVEYTDYQVLSRPSFQYEYTTGTLDVSGTAYVRVPLTKVLGVGVSLDEYNKIQLGRSGLYEVNAVVTLLSTAADFRACSLRLGVESQYAAIATQSIVRGIDSGNYYATVTLSAVVEASLSDGVFLEARNGDILYRAVVSGHWIGEANLYETI